MKIITQEIKVYDLDDIKKDDNLKEKVLDYFQFLDYGWYEWTCQDAENIGIKITSFHAEHGQITGEALTDYTSIKNAILKGHGKTCETYKTVKRYDLRKGEDEGEEMFNELLQDYLQMLRQEIEYLTSEEAIFETIEANDYKFTSDGKIYN